MAYENKILRKNKKGFSARETARQPKLTANYCAYYSTKLIHHTLVGCDNVFQETRKPDISSNSRNKRINM